VARRWSFALLWLSASLPAVGHAASFRGLGILPGETSSQAYGVSSDGFVVVGESSSSAGEEAFRWTSGSGMVGLGNLAPGKPSLAQAVSADGSVVVGTSGNLYAHNDAFRWTSDGGMVALDTGGIFFSYGNGVSADGSVIVGYYGGQGFCDRLPLDRKPRHG
jgi:probable HAF family extracellular repeat protein